MPKPWPPPRAAELDLDALDVLADGAMAGYLERRWFGVGVGDYRLMADNADEADEVFICACSPPTVKALIARVRRAEREVMRQYDGAEPGTLLGTFVQLAVELQERHK